MYSLSINTYAGLVDATLGWAISWAIGPGRIITPTEKIVAILLTVLFVTVHGAVGGLAGGLISKASHLAKRRFPYD